MEWEHLLREWGWLALFCVVFAEQVGLPLPTLPVLLLAGALAAQQQSGGIAEVLAATLGSLLGGWIWYQFGKRHGRRVLRLLCRISLSPDVCVRQTELSFEKRGPATLVMARFIPGLHLLAAPLAGGIHMPARTFLTYHGLGALLYAVLGIGGGLLFYEPLRSLLQWITAHGERASAAALVLFLLWLVRRYWSRRFDREALSIARITPRELAEALASPEPPLVLDARSLLAREQAAGIPEAIAVDWEDASSLRRLPKERSFVTYCACPNDASAVALAKRLRKAGYRNVQVLAGGLDDWFVHVGASGDAAPEESGAPPAERTA